MVRILFIHSIRLQCELSLLSKSTVTWYHNELEISPSKRIFVTRSNTISTLNIASALAEDSGEYVCSAVNNLGEAKTKTVLTVKS